ncbi:MAG: Xaa-Pro peptidase family protein [Pyrinomonadaceae bacterium]
MLKTQKRLSRIVLIIMFFATAAAAQNIPLFTEDFNAAEFTARREKLFDAIGRNGVAVLQGEPSPRGYVRFRQSNEFYYLTGVEVPHAYLLLDGGSRRAALYIPHRNEGREAGEGKMLSSEDSELITKNTRIQSVYGSELFAEHLSRYVRRTGSIIYTPFSPPEGFAESRDLGIRVQMDIASDAWDAGMARHIRFRQLLAERLPGLEIKDLSPVLDQMRLIKSAAEMDLIRKATRLSGLALMESMRSTKPGMKEYELDAVAKYIYYRNGGQGDAYYSLIAAAENAYFPHYHKGKGTMKDGDLLLMDYAPDYGYYMSDVTRMWPVNGKFSRDQRDLYGFYLACYKSILYNIRSGKTPGEISEKAAQEMEQHLAKASFSKDIYKKAAENFVNSYKAGAGRRSMLGHWVGMATHDVGQIDGPLRAGMVFTIEPALRVPEEMIYIRLEDLLIIHENSVEIVSEFVPMEIDAIEKLMTEEGMSQKYPRESVP